MKRTGTRGPWLSASICLLFALFGGFAQVDPVLAQQPAIEAQARTPIYALARATSEIRGYVEIGTTVEVANRVNEWALVRLPGGLTGWVEYAVLTGQSAPSRPPPPTPDARAPTQSVRPPPGSGGLPTEPGSGTSERDGGGFYHTDRNAGFNYLRVEDSNQLSFAMARMAGRSAEIGFTLSGTRTPVPGSDPFHTASVAGNFRVFPLQPSGQQPLGVVLEAVARVTRALDDRVVDDQVAGVGGAIGAFARLAAGGGSTIVIPKAVVQVTRLIPIPDDNDAGTTDLTEWYVGAELQLESIIPGVFVGASDGESFVSLQVTFAY